MDITPPREGEGTEALRRSNRQKGVAPTGAIAPIRPLQASNGGGEQPPAPPSRPPLPGRNERTGVELRRGADRREREDRRLDGDTAWLDTRSNRKRRTNLRRVEDRARAAEAPPDAPPPYGINTKA
jgi:hypothetical protein